MLIPAILTLKEEKMKMGFLLEVVRVISAVDHIQGDIHGSIEHRNHSPSLESPL